MLKILALERAKSGMIIFLDDRGSLMPMVERSSNDL